jgi:hypothetical protein
MRGSGGIPQLLLSSTLDVDEWLVSRPSWLSSRERVPGTHLIGGCVSRSVGLSSIEDSSGMVSRSYDL